MQKKKYTSREKQRENKKLYSKLNKKNECGFNDLTPYEAIKNIREKNKEEFQWQSKRDYK